MYRLAKLGWIIVASASLSAVANDPARKPAMNSEKKGTTQIPTAVPFDHFWDSNAWEPRAAGNFWHSLSESEPVLKRTVLPLQGQSRVWTRRPASSQSQKNR